jgi:hypothetical protein
MRQPRSGGILLARHVSAGKVKVEQTESALADGTNFATDAEGAKLRNADATVDSSSHALLKSHPLSPIH